METRLHVHNTPLYHTTRAERKQSQQPLTTSTHRPPSPPHSGLFLPRSPLTLMRQKVEHGVFIFSL